MVLMLLGIFLFMATHLFTAWARAPRQALIGQIGELGYKGLYSVISLAGMVLLVMGWKAWPEGAGVQLYPYVSALVPVTYVLVFVAFVMTTAAYAPSGKIAGALKHPMIAGLKVWALSHLLVNGDLRSVIVFGSLLAYGVIDGIAVKKRGDLGRSAGPIRNDAIVISAATVGYLVVFLYLHPYIAGVSVVGG